jgi:glycine cleavage system H protein
MTIPTDLHYTEQHEWLQLDGDTARVGVTAYAADALGDVVFIELPDVGSKISAGETCGELESTKSVSDLFAPADGEVLEINQAVVEDPALLNNDPFVTGWLFVMRVEGSPQLLDATAYTELTGA